jgi:AraC-like DNA-binding protein
MWQSWNTARIARNRADFWSDVVANGVLHAEMRAKDTGNFSGRLASRTVSGARFVSFKTAAHRVSRTVAQAARGDAHFMVSLQCRGVSHIVQGDREIALLPRGIAILDSSLPFEIDFPQEVERRLVLLPRRLVEPWLRRVSNGPVLLPDCNASIQIARHAILHLTDTGLNWNSSDCASVVDALARLLQGALDDTGHDTNRVPATLRLDTLKQAIRQRLHQADLTPATAARSLNISARTLHRLFEADGQSFARYVQTERLVRARALIERGATSLTLTQIALECGFGDASHFSRSYRNHFGEAPRDTRSRVRRETNTITAV